MVSNGPKRKSSFLWQNLTSNTFVAPLIVSWPYWGPFSTTWFSILNFVQDLSSFNIIPMFYSPIFFTNKLFWCKRILMLCYFHVISTIGNIYLVCKNKEQWFFNGRSIYWIILTIQLIKHLFGRFLELHSLHLFSSHFELHNRNYVSCHWATKLCLTNFLILGATYNIKSQGEISLASKWTFSLSSPCLVFLVRTFSKAFNLNKDWLEGFKTLNGHDFRDLEGFRTLDSCIGHDFVCIKGIRTQWHCLMNVRMWAWTHEHDRMFLKYFNDMDNIVLDYSLLHKLES